MIRLLLPLLLLCSSCIQLGGEPQPTRFYLLEAVAEFNEVSSAQKILLELGPIEFPTYLDRPQIVSRMPNNTIVIAEYDRWAEPLPDNLTRTLKENLNKRLAGAQISTAPWSNHADQGYAVRLTINRFDGIIGQQTEVDIRWSLYSPAGDQELLRKHFIGRIPIDNNYQGLVAGLNKVLSELSKEIATAVNRQR
jgi:uncharacterized lipoprotein YmbA